MKQEIKSIIVDGVGLITDDPTDAKNRITLVQRKDGTATLPWFKQGNKEWNGNFVIQIEYY